MAVTAFLKLAVELSDDHGRQQGPGPWGVGWTAIDDWENRRVTLDGEADTQIVVPDGATFVVIDPGAATDLAFKGRAADVGVPFCGTTLPLKLPLAMPLGDDAQIWIENLGVADVDVRVWFF